MNNVSKKPLNVNPSRFELVEEVPPKTEKGMLVQVIESGKYYEYDGEEWIEIEPKEALKKWKKRMSSCISKDDSRLLKRGRG